jgi:protein-disulfide isomerase
MLQRRLSCLLSLCVLCLVCLLSACAPQPAVRSANQAKAEAPGEARPRLPMPHLDAAAAPAGSEVERIFAIAPSAAAPKIGKADAKVVLQVCSDFECPFCARLVPTVHELVENYGDLIRVEWRHCPLPFHKLALPASEAAVEVYKQAGDAAFWTYHDVLFSHQSSLETDKLPELARGIAGVDAEKVKLALSDHRHAAAVRKDLNSVIDSGAASGGFGTPATFVNGRLLSGAQPYEAFEQAVERALIETPEALAEAKAKSDLVYPMARAKHILVQYKGAQGAPPTVTRTQEEARALAEQLLTQLSQPGADFAQLAREKSDCPSREQGGELGRFTRGDLVPQFEAALFALRVGELSGVVETPFGYHLIVREE